MSRRLLLVLFLGLLSLCEGFGVPARIRLQTDWFPQAEHGGFYQALAKGFYADEGLDVEILPGGPGTGGIKLRVAKGDAEFGMNRSDDVLVARARGLPLVIAGAVLQHDHQALLVHADSPVRTLADLDGREVIAAVGQTWIPFLQKRYGIRFDLRPLTYGLGPFFADRATIQQCLVTNEPFFAAERGVPVRVLPLSDSGFDPYHVIFSSAAYLRNHPEEAAAFLRASVRGWLDYLDGDPSPAHAEILRRNPHTHGGILEFSRAEIIRRRLFHGRLPEDGPGKIRIDRVAAELAVLAEFGVVPAGFPLEGAVWNPDAAPVRAKDRR